MSLPPGRGGLDKQSCGHDSERGVIITTFLYFSPYILQLLNHLHLLGIAHRPGLGLTTGVPRVDFCDTVPVPVDTGPLRVTGENGPRNIYGVSKNPRYFMYPRVSHYKMCCTAQLM